MARHAQGLGHRVVLEHQQAVEQRVTALPGPALDIEQGRVLMLTQARLSACTACSQSATDWAGCGVAITGRVLMNRPICSIPGSSSGRPATVGHRGLPLALQQQ